jgi:hypothetical protein
VCLSSPELSLEPGQLLRSKHSPLPIEDGCPVVIANRVVENRGVWWVVGLAVTADDACVDHDKIQQVADLEGPVDAELEVELHLTHGLPLVPVKRGF